MKYLRQLFPGTFHLELLLVQIFELCLTLETLLDYLFTKKVLFFLAGADKLFFVTTNPEDQADEALTGMFKFLAAKETDSVKGITIRLVDFFS